MAEKMSPDEVLSDLDILSEEPVEDVDIGCLEMNEVSKLFKGSALRRQDVHAFSCMSSGVPGITFLRYNTSLFLRLKGLDDRRCEAVGAEVLPNLERK